LPIVAIAASCSGSADRGTDTAAAINAITASASTSRAANLPSLDKAQRYALIVAIRDYPNPSHNLPGPLQDASAIRRVLMTRFGIMQSNILQLSNRGANREAVIAAFRNHLAKADSNGVALFYFIGHGLDMDRNYSVQDPEQSGRDQALYLWGANGSGAILLDDELNVLLRDLPAKRRIVIIDACYSGTSIKNNRGLGHRIVAAGEGDAGDSLVSIEYLMNVKYQRAGDPAQLPQQFISDGQQLADIDSLPLVFMSAADEKEPAWSATNWPTTNQSRSVFSFYLETNLRTYDNTKSFETLVSDVRAGVSARPACVKQRARCQTPQLRGALARESLMAVLGSP